MKKIAVPISIIGTFVLTIWIYLGIHVTSWSIDEITKHTSPNAVTRSECVTLVNNKCWEYHVTYSDGSEWDVHVFDSGEVDKFRIK